MGMAEGMNADSFNAGGCRFAFFSTHFESKYRGAGVYFALAESGIKSDGKEHIKIPISYTVAAFGKLSGSF